MYPQKEEGWCISRDGGLFYYAVGRSNNDNRIKREDSVLFGYTCQGYHVDPRYTTRRVHLLCAFLCLGGDDQNVHFLQLTKS